VIEMKQLLVAREVWDLTDEEIEGCMAGVTTVKLIKFVFLQPSVVQKTGYINPDVFGDVFAYELARFICADEGTEEWLEAFNNNFIWGVTIAENLNEILEPQHID
jgi:hypothetical protein